MKEANFQLAREEEDSLHYQTYFLSNSTSTIILDTVTNKDGSKAILETQARIAGIDHQPSHPDYRPKEQDYATGVQVEFTKKDTSFVARPVLVLRDQLLYTFPVQMNDLSFKVRLTDEALAQLFPSEEELGYQKFTFKQGDNITLDGNVITFKSFDKDPKHPNYKKEEGDISIGAFFEVASPRNREIFTTEPLYLIRGTSPFNLKSEVGELGLHFRFTGINPNEETIEVLIAHKETNLENLPVQIARKSYRTDYIVLEAIVFPGINFFWLGAVLMMFGLGVGMFRRMNQK